MKLKQLCLTIVAANFIIISIVDAATSERVLTRNSSDQASQSNVKYGTKINRKAVTGGDVSHSLKSSGPRNRSLLAKDEMLPKDSSESQKSRNSRRYDTSQVKPTPKNFKQYDIPLPKKDFEVKHSQATKSQRYQEPLSLEKVDKYTPTLSNTNRRNYVSFAKAGDTNYVTDRSKAAVKPSNDFLRSQERATHFANSNYRGKTKVSAGYDDRQQRGRNTANESSLLSGSKSGTRKSITNPEISTIAATTNPSAVVAATKSSLKVSKSHQSNQNQFEANNPLQFVWNLFNPVTLPPETTPVPFRKPPKKYRPATTPVSAAFQYNTAKEEKIILKKVKTTTAAPFTTSPKSEIIISSTQKLEGPFRIALPTLLNRPTDKDKRGATDSSEKLRDLFICPRENEVRFQLFPKICQTDNDCSVWQREELCCDIFGAKSCVSGVPKPLKEAKHAPILGFIPRKCPSRPLAELWWDVQECHTDMDCWPRVCCPDGRRRYCRTSQPELETIPEPVKRSFDYLTEYLECTPPPPRIFDLHPKACTSSLDCFPNVCCQEAGLRHCRPPKKSVLTLMANFLNVDFVKRLTQNIVIK